MKNNEAPKKLKSPSPGASTLEDIAQQTGVSAMTISRAINKPELVSAKTRKKVWDVIDALGYIPNQLATALLTNQSKIIALMIPTISNSIYSAFVQGVTEVLARDGYHVLLAITHYEAEVEESILTTVLGRQPDGVILTGTQQSDRTRRILAARRTPVVQTWDLSTSGIDQVVGFSHTAAGEAIARYALHKGYKRIGLLWLNDPRGGMRLAALRSVLEQHSITPVAIEIVPVPASQQSGRNGLSRLLETAQDMDIVICSSDELAMGVYSEARHRGLTIPGSIAVMGFGDLEAAAAAEPALTTVRVNSRLIGERAAEALISRIKHPDIDEKKSIDTGFEIIERDSA